VSRPLPELLRAIDASALRAAPASDVIDWIHASLQALVMESDQEASALAPETLGSPLSRAVLNDAIAVACGIGVDLERAAASLAGREPAGRVAMVLPSNVETAAIRPLVWALLARDAVALRVSSRRAGVTRRFAEVLAEHDRELARALAVVSFPRQDVDDARTLFRWADVVHAWGDDTTMDALHAIEARRPLVRHGRGLGLAMLDGSEVDSLGADTWEALAVDVARHDQRGCLSPHALLVVGATADQAAEAGHALDRALSGLAAWFPRGALDEHERASARIWRDTALAIGSTLLEGSAHAIAVERGPLRSCPTGRHLAVHAMADLDARALVRTLGPHLKTVGLPSEEAVARAPEWLRDAGAHVVPWGAMQTPGLLAPSDGARPWTGFITEQSGLAERRTEP